MIISLRNVLVGLASCGTLALFTTNSFGSTKPTCERLSVSRFWQQLDTVCRNRPALGAAISALPPAQQADAQAVLAYCDARAIPALASASLSTRAERLKNVAQVAGVMETQLGSAVEVLPQVALGILDRAAAEVAPDSSLQTGAVGDLLVGELTGAVCKQSAAGQWLASTCGPTGGEPALIALRHNLVRDVAELPARAAERSGLQPQQLPGQQELRATVAFVRAALSDNAPYELAAQLATRVLDQSYVASWCDANDSGVNLPNLDSSAKAAYVLFRLLADGRSFDRPDEYYRSVIMTALAGSIQPSAVVDEAVARLMPALRALTQLQLRLNAGSFSTTELVERVRLLITVSDSLFTISTGQRFVLPAPAPELVIALLQARLEAAVSSALAIVQNASFAPVSSENAKMIGVAVRFALARDEAEAKRILRGLILPLGPWSENILFDINGDIPQLESGEFKLVGDALLGYNARSWGIAARGSFAEYDFSTRTRLSETTVADGSLESWFVSSTTAKLRFELRLVARASLYDTNQSNAGFSDETSVMGRGSLLGSVRYQPGTRAAFGLWLGGGAQYESYDGGDYVSRTAVINDTETFGYLLNARVRAEVVIIPSWFTSRLRVDGQRFELTRARLETVAGGGTVTETASTELAEQIEITTRLFLDAEVLRLGGFVPSLNAGFDSVIFRSNTESHDAFVPVFGAGIRRETF